MYLSTLFIRSLKESTNAPFRLSVSTDIPLFQAQIDLHSDNGQGPRPIHWASRNGHVAVVDVLLGVSPRRDVSDIDRDINLTTYVYYRVVQLDFTQEIEVFNMLFVILKKEKVLSNIMGNTSISCVNSVRPPALYKFLHPEFLAHTNLLLYYSCSFRRTFQWMRQTTKASRR